MDGHTNEIKKKFILTRKDEKCRVICSDEFENI